MNIADIRKKAQRERLNRESNASFGGAGDARDDHGASTVLSGAGPPGVPTDGLPASPLPEPDAPFDPLGMILAGREAVRAASHQSVVPESGMHEELTGFLGFTVGGETHAIELDRVREIIRPRRVTPVPQAPVSITGILSHRGAIITVLDLSGRLGIDHGSTSGSKRIIVVRKGGGLCGLLVDGVGRVVMLSASSVEPVPAGLTAENREFVSGVARYRGAMLILLNLDKVLDIGAPPT
jgi:purine-binding chemotaxis protein CheW